MVSVDDARLVELAAEPPQPLLPLLDRAEAMSPLVVLMAVLPGLAGLVAVTPHGGGGAITAVGRIDPPWAAWLARQPWRELTGEDALWQVLPSWLATVILVWLAWHAGRALFGPRTGLLAVVVVCCHTPVLMLGRDTEPRALAAVLATLTLVGFMTHRQRGQRAGSVLLAGVAASLSATVLLATSLTIPVLILLGVVAACRPPGQVGLWRNGIGTPRSVVGGGWRGPICLLVVVIAATGLLAAWISWGGDGTTFAGLSSSATAGWWSEGGLGHWGGELAGRAATVVGWLGVLSGLVLLGGWDLVRGGLARGAPGQRSAWLALAWVTLGVAAWMTAAAGYPERLSEAFVAVPLALLAARGFEAVCDRKFSVATVVALTVLSVYVDVDSATWLRMFEPGGVLVPAVLVWGVLGASVGISLMAATACRGSEPRSRRMLTACLMFLLVVHVVGGWLRLPVEAIGGVAAAI